jgi:hypothetical protein
METGDLKEGMPTPLADLIDARRAGDTTPISLDRLLPGGAFEDARTALLSTGLASVRDVHGREMVLSASFDDAGNMMDVAAAIPRKGASSVDFLNQIEDFNELTNLSNSDRKDRVALYHRIYKADGTTNNAISKMASLVAPRCTYKVMSLRGQRGRTNEDTKLRASTITNWWIRNVNASAVDAVVTGSRGIQTWIRRGARLAFIEGDHIGRRYWHNAEIPGLGKFDLPMNLQTFSSQYIDPVEGLEFTDIELYYWKPPQKFIQQLQQAVDPNLDKILRKYIPSKVKTELIRTGKHLLDPALLIHIKNQGTDINMFGESLVAPTLPAVRYIRALDALEMTVITNIMARVVIIKVGSDNEKSVYHKAEVTQNRLGVLQRAFQGAGPNATLLWGGPDIDVLEVSAHNALLDLVPRYEMAERRQLMALGVPMVLMIGEGNSGKAAGYASAMAAVSRCKELQDQYKQVIEQICQEILLENGFADVDGVLEWEENILDDREAAADLMLKMFQLGLTTAETTLGTIGLDYGVEVERQEKMVADGYKEEVFGPPKAAMTNNPMGNDPSGSGGRPANSPKKDPRTNKETKTKEPNR